MKTCNRCGRRKALREFHRHASGHRGVCKECRKIYSRRYQTENREAISLRRKWRAYGITPEQFTALLAGQGRTCAICTTAEPGGRGWHVDHNHDTGAVRGLLCNLCNPLLGHARDDIGILQSAISYLTRETN